jgi:hypothetical protein
VHNRGNNDVPSSKLVVSSNNGMVLISNRSFVRSFVREHSTIASMRYWCVSIIVSLPMVFHMYPTLSSKLLKDFSFVAVGLQRYVCGNSKAEKGGSGGMVIDQVGW